MTALPPPGPHGGDGPAVAAALGLPAHAVLDLSVSLNPAAPDATALARRHAAALRRYPDDRRATAALAEALGVSTDRLLLTNGGAEAIALVAAERPVGWVEEPEFSLYRRHLERLDPGAPRWRSNPNNPTGLLAGAGEHAAVWDEAFYPLATGTWTRGDAAAGAVVIGSLTKLFACPGLRVGYVLAPDPELTMRLRARQPAWALGGLAVAALPELLDRADLPGWARTVADLRAGLVELLARYGLVAAPSDACWVLVHGVPHLRAALARQGVVVRDCASFGLPGTVRVGVPDERGLELLDRALARAAAPTGPGPVATPRALGRAPGSAPPGAGSEQAAASPEAAGRASAAAPGTGSERSGAPRGPRPAAASGTPPPAGAGRAWRAAAGRVRPLDEDAVTAARARHDRLTKPRGSLGRLEDLGVQLAGIAGACPPPPPDPAVVVVFAADHGVVRAGVTPWPQEVTAQMVANLAAGGAAINVLAAQAGATVVVVDVGVASARPPGTAVLDRRIRPGTADLSQGPAMSTGDVEAALDAGAELAATLVGAGNRCLVTGEMGIGNTTAAAAVVAAITGRPPVAVTGRGTGIDDETLARKRQVVHAAVARLAGRRGDPLAVLTEVGGLEIAALAGLCIGGAAGGVPVVVDGLIAGAALLAAEGLAPGTAARCVAGHRSTEPGATAALDHLGMAPLLDLDMRLGEGTGACLALPLLRAASAVLAGMATFGEAHVTDAGT